MSVLELLFIASAASTAVFGAYLAMTHKYSQLKALTPQDYIWSAGLGFLNPFLYYAMVLKAYSWPWAAPSSGPSTGFSTRGTDATRPSASSSISRSDRCSF